MTTKLNTNERDSLLGPRLKKMVEYHKHAENLANQRNYVYEQEAKQLEQDQLMLEDGDAIP